MFQRRGVWSIEEVSPSASNVSEQMSPQHMRQMPEQMSPQNTKQMLDEDRIRLCSSIVVADVQALKAEFEILKRSVEEEVQARRTGDALNSEACMQMQAVLEYEGNHPGSGHNLEGQIQTCYNKLSEEIADLRLGLEAEVLVRLQGDDKLEKLLLPLRASSNESLDGLRKEIENEVRQRTTEIDRLRNSMAAAIQETIRLEYSQKMSDQIVRERSERQTEDQSLHRLISDLANQTNAAVEEEANRLWGALHTHNHDVIIEGKRSSHLDNVQVQTLGSTGLQSSPRKIQLQGPSDLSTYAMPPPPLHTAPHNPMQQPRVHFPGTSNTDGKRGGSTEAPWYPH